MTRGSRIFLALACLAAARPAAAMIVNIDGPFDGPMVINGNVDDDARSQAMLWQSLQQTLAMPRESGKDVWAWREEVEDRLVGLGERALPVIQLEMDRRQGYELDALQVALLRLEHPGLDPADAISQWARRQFHTTTPPHVARVMWSAGPVLMPRLFPNHLFYVVENRGAGGGQRWVVAVAADARIDVINDDADLAAFVKREGAPVRNEAERAALAGSLGVLVTSRFIDVYSPEAMEVAPIDAGDGAAWRIEAHVRAGGKASIVTVKVDAQGKVAGIVSRDEGAPEAGASPGAAEPAGRVRKIEVPTGGAVPPMPD
jgi:hypothetical protein